MSDNPDMPMRWPRPAMLGPAAAALMLAGASAALLLPALPPMWLTAMIVAVTVPTAWRWPQLRLIALPLLAASWMLLRADIALQSRLPQELVGADLPVTVRVVGLPEPGERQLRFDARVEQAPPDAAGLLGERIRLAWYGDPATRFQPGERWQLNLRLKRPRGSQNAGGFDYERYALEQGIAATGHVRETPLPQRLSASGGIDALRARVSAELQQACGPPACRFLRGLAVGDRRDLTDADWERLRATGLSHLLAISGLHIGLLAGFGVVVARLLYRLWPSLGLRVPRPQGSAALALPFAVAYALLAGFGLPVMRSLLMIGCVLLAVLLRRGLGPAQALALAFLVILLVDPLALLGAGFWLSFLGVGWLILCLPGSRGEDGIVVAYTASLLRAQWVLSLGLLPLTVWFFGQASLAGAFANLIAVALVALLVVPLTLLGTALLPFPTVAAWPLLAAAWLMAQLWQLAGWLESFDWAQVALPEPSIAALLLALLGLVWLLLPRGVPGKPLASLLLLPLLLPSRAAPPDAAFDVTVIDVGQGLAVLVQTRQHALLYDAGPAYPGGLDLGEAAVLPSLRALGVRRLDAMVISHGDNDHAGGSGAVRRALSPPLLLTGEPQRMALDASCADAQWRWDDVDFRMLHPPPHFPEIGNDASCVLSVRSAAGHLLLPGDIGRLIEGRLLRDQPDLAAVDVLLIPHHGSAGSSDQAFVTRIAPKIAVVASGHDNRFGHPRAEVIARYVAVGSQIEGTAAGGALTLRLREGRAPEISRRRETARRFWHEDGAPAKR